MLNSNQRKQVPQTCALPLGQLSHLNKSTFNGFVKLMVQILKQYCCTYSLICADSGDPTHACLLIGSQVCACNYTIPANGQSYGLPCPHFLSTLMRLFQTVYLSWENHASQTLINTPLVTLVRVSVWHFFLQAQPFRRWRADDGNRNHILSMAN